VVFHLFGTPTVSTTLSKSSEGGYFPVLDQHGIFMKLGSQEFPRFSSEGGAFKVQSYRGSISFANSNTYRGSVAGQDFPISNVEFPLDSSLKTREEEKIDVPE